MYVLGLTTERESAEIRAYSALHPEIMAEITAIENCLEHHAMVHSVNPAAQVKEKLFDTIGKRSANVTEQTKAPVVPINKPFTSWKYVAAACIVLLLGSIFFNYTYYNKYREAGNSISLLEKEKTDLALQLNTQQQLAAAMKKEDDEMRNKWKIEPVVLNGMPDASDSKAKILWMKNSGDVYIDPANLPDAPDGMQYQFWGIVDGKPVDGGMIITTTKEDKYRIQKMKSFGRAEAFAVTLETMGGNPQPKGKMYVMGKM